MYGCLRFWGLLVSVFLLFALRGSLATEAPATVQAILTESEVRGGIVVHLGCTSADLAVAFGGDEKFLVHALAHDRQVAEKARKQVDAARLTGPVSVEHLQAAALPYVDNLINLVVVENAGQVPIEEVMRVLVPGGVACVKQAGSWAYKVKPRPASIDQWTHFLHDASNNAVAEDALVGPPRSLQWGARATLAAQPRDAVGHPIAGIRGRASVLFL